MAKVPARIASRDNIQTVASHYLLTAGAKFCRTTMNIDLLHTAEMHNGRSGTTVPSPDYHEIEPDGGSSNYSLVKLMILKL